MTTNPQARYDDKIDAMHQAERENWTRQGIAAWDAIARAWHHREYDQPNAERLEAYHERVRANPWARMTRVKALEGMIYGFPGKS